MLTLIAARAKDGAIGKDGGIPWHAPEDLSLFKAETLGGAIIMGRRTWDSLPKRPLPNRLNCVVTSREIEDQMTAGDPVEAVRRCYAHGMTRVYGIGGQGIYEALLPHADRLMLTEVDMNVPGADAFFPAFDETEWHVLRHAPLREDAPRCLLVERVRRRPRK